MPRSGNVKPEHRVSTEVVSRELKKTGLSINQMQEMSGINERNLRAMIHQQTSYCHYKTAETLCKSLGIEPTDMGV